MHVLGMIEFRGIAAGIFASDAMAKRAPVEFLRAGPIDPGKYLAAITGDLACVEESIAAGVAAGAGDVVYSFVLPNVHSEVVRALGDDGAAPERDAVGIVETASAVAAVRGADAACKAAPVVLALIHLAHRIGGKGYFVVVGDVADVEAAEEAARVETGGELVDGVVIPNPDEAYYARILDPTRYRRS